MRHIRNMIGVCFLAAALLLTACAAGGASEPKIPETIPETRLEILEVPVIYSDAERAELSARLAALGASAVRAFGGAVLTPSETEALAASAEQVYLPFFQARAVTFREADLLCQEAERLFSVGEVPDLFACYQTAVSLLGVRRAGLLAFDVVSQLLRDKAEQCRERYETYGYEWYLNDEIELRAIEARLCNELGDERFANACALGLFCGSFGVGVLPTDGELAERMTSAEVLLILRRQAEVFSAWDITAEQWELVAEALAQVLPSGSLRPKSLTDYQSAEWSALKEEGYFIRLAQSVPVCIRLFAVLAEHLCAEETDLLRYGSETEQLAVLCRLLTSGQDAFAAFLSEVEPIMRTDTARERNQIARKGLIGEFAAFEAQMIPVTSQKLLNTIAAFGNTPTEENRAELLQTVRAYCFGIAPCATFAFLRGVGQPAQKGEQT